MLITKISSKPALRMYATKVAYSKKFIIRKLKEIPESIWNFSSALLWQLTKAGSGLIIVMMEVSSPRAPIRARSNGSGSCW